MEKRERRRSTNNKKKKRERFRQKKMEAKRKRKKEDERKSNTLAIHARSNRIVFCSQIVQQQDRFSSTPKCVCDGKEKKSKRG